jgi:ribonuclease-3
VTEVELLQKAIGYRFEESDLGELALTHRSYASEHKLAVSYERLEFLGDAVLQLAVTRYLYDTYPELPEGEMAKVRAAVVNQKSLASIARRLGMGPAIRLGHGEELSGGRDKDSILADIMEAVLGAVYLDGGYAAAERIVLGEWVGLVDDRARAPGRRDYKTRLQELLAQRGRIPRYEVTATGPDHAKTFSAEVWVDGRQVGSGTGTSKKRAEQAAAEVAWTRLTAPRNDA